MVIYYIVTVGIGNVYYPYFSKIIFTLAQTEKKAYLLYFFILFAKTRTINNGIPTGAR